MKSGELPEQFHLLTRKGMRHVRQSTQNEHLETKASSYSGLYLKSKHNHRDYAPKFRKQYERLLLDEKRAKEKKRSFEKVFLWKRNQSSNEFGFSRPFTRNKSNGLKSGLGFKKTVWNKKQRKDFEKILNEHFASLEHCTNERIRPSKTNENKAKKVVNKSHVRTVTECQKGKRDLLSDLTLLRARVQSYILKSDLRLNS